MNIQFNYHGATYKAGLEKRGDNTLEVEIKDNALKEQFGKSLPFFVENQSVGFNMLNKGHSDLYALNSSISKAIAEQYKELL
ncbi:MAG: hypothetical protein M3040_01725 [Bacteroidota bacterium]|nr:hypothetical protein [Bacteroidota bacterium]